MRLLRIEWMKLRSYPPIWWLLASYPIAVGGLTYLMTRFQQALLSQPNEVLKNAIGGPFSFPLVWHTVAYIGSWFHFIPCTLVLVSICNEFQFRTHRQNLLDGWSRAQFFTSKVLLTLAISLYCTTVVGGLALLMGILTSGVPTGEGVEMIGLFAVQTTGYCFFALLLSFWLRRGLLGLGFFLFYTNLFEHVLRFFVWRQSPPLSYLMPINTFNNLIPFPVLRAVTRDFSKDCPPNEVLLGVAAVYLLIYLGVSWLRYRREDL